MYKITIGDDIFHISKPRWLKQVNKLGVTMIVNSNENDATGIRFNEVNYHIKGKPKMSGLETVKVEKEKEKQNE